MIIEEKQISSFKPKVKIVYKPWLFLRILSRILPDKDCQSYENNILSDMEKTNCTA